MPRPRNDILHSFFKVNSEDLIVCQRCDDKVLNGHTTNLEKHLKRVHPKVFNEYIKRKSGIIVDTKLEKVSKPKIIKSTDKNIELALIEIFTKKGCPIKLMEDRAFRALIQPALDKIGIIANHQNILKRILVYAHDMKKEIANEVKGKFVSLKVDAVTQQGLSLLGINIQYTKNKALVLKTLAVKELKSSYNSGYLQSIVLDVLEDYKIDVSQILTLTIDNGTHTLNSSKYITNKTFPDNEESARFAASEKLENLQSMFIHQNIVNVPCGGQTLELCAQDVMLSPNIKQRIDRFRVISKKLKAKNVNILKRGQTKKPILDCPTRWSSTYEMLQILQDIRDSITNMGTEDPELVLGNDELTFLAEFLIVFKPIYDAMLKLQSQILCFSELYVIIMDITIQLENTPHSKLKSMLLETLHKRKARLIDNELFNVAIFLDPRIKICLNPAQTIRAKEYAHFLQRRITKLKDSDSTDFIDDPLKISVCEDILSSRIAQRPKSFSELLQNLDPTHEKKPTIPSISNLEADLMSYEQEARLPLDTNILDFWSTKYNSLSTIAYILCAIPSTQISVECLLSALTYIFQDDNRTRLSTYYLEQIILIRLNGEINYGST